MTYFITILFFLLFFFHFFFFFFFSSRRRHTRWTGDWSSDVCSSDLFTSAFRQSRNAMVLLDGERRHIDVNGAYVRMLGYPRQEIIGVPASQYVRSEERRVGKECRSRWSPDHCKKKEKKIESRGIIAM